MPASVAPDPDRTVRWRVVEGGPVAPARDRAKAGAVAISPRRDAGHHAVGSGVLRRGERRLLQRLMLVGLIGLASFSLYHGITDPIIKLTQLYIFTDEHSLYSAVQALSIDHEYLLAAIVLIFSITMPTLKLVWLLVLSLLPERRLAALHRSLEWLESLGKWSMHDVLILSLTIVYLRASGLSEAVSMPGVRYFVVAVMVIMIAYGLIRGMARNASIALNGRASLLAPPPAAGLSMPRRILVGLLTLAASAALCYGVGTPVIELTKFWWWTDRHSILSAVQALYLEGEYFLSAVIFVFSVLFPVLKLSYLFAVCMVVTPRPDLQQRMLRRLEWLGKWSMMDVLVLALTVFYVNASQFAQAVALPGIYAFTASVFLTMLAYALVKSGFAGERQADEPRTIVVPERSEPAPELEHAA